MVAYSEALRVTEPHWFNERAFGAKKSAMPFKHAGKNMLGEITLFSSYHCSRYNTNTGVLTTEMFRDVFEKVRAYLD